MSENPSDRRNATLSDLSKVSNDNKVAGKVKEDGYNLSDVKIEIPPKTIKVDTGVKENWNLIVGFCILAVMLILEYGFRIPVITGKKLQPVQQQRILRRNRLVLA